ncbi:uncharacterized protein B0J16DRAFT_349397 [Fusarium flagelliforme]|uniref:uncharacterized protein n=1 Tax=Fusarium flagelliforme TaxID=2675880 RepID=UPI001E8EB516|nr:uncharacterized protein B0J16DRAFT_349397 [Fusarium flagelliforme]KAH7174968.1 hypothetical protein B0J16DRAFT_349397 [Fusarium flagelliforme]
MVKPRNIIAGLVGIGITGVNAGPCKPISVSIGSSAEASATSALTASGFVTSSSIAELSTSISSSIQSSTDLTTETETTAISESSITAASTTTGSIEFTSTVISLSESTIATTTDFTSTLTETTTAAATTSAVADIPCNNQIYRGTAQNRGYTSTDAQSEADCWEACSADEQCNTWFFQTAGVCQLYREQFDAMSSPRNEDSNLIGSRNCSPRDYSPCGDNIGFGSISASPIESVQQVLLEKDCAQLCMKDGRCDVWQYDGMLKTCHKLTGQFEDIFTPQADAQGAKILLAGSRSCSSDFFKPQLEYCNDQINTWDANTPIGYRHIAELKTIPLCARACSIDPQCLSWGIFDGGMINSPKGCDLSQYVYDEDRTDVGAAGSRNCGVP